jgi:hypothetical protein
MQLDQRRWRNDFGVVGAMVAGSLGCELAEAFVVLKIEQGLEVCQSLGVGCLVAPLVGASCGTPDFSSAARTSRMAAASGIGWAAAVAKRWHSLMRSHKSSIGSSGFHSDPRIKRLASISSGLMVP